MKTFSPVAEIAAVVLCVATAGSAAELDTLNLLYIGDTGTPRAQQFTGFLGKNVGWERNCHYCNGISRSGSSAGGSLPW